MKMKVLAVAVAALVCGTHAFAAEIFNDNNGTAMAVGGHVSVNVNGTDDWDANVGTNSPRLNLTGTKDIGYGVKVDARGEWALNYLDGGGNTFTTRLGYIGVTYDQYGRIVAGTQWAPYYDVAGVTDFPIAFANDFLYGAGFNELGSSRAEKMISYRKSFQFGDGLAFNLGLGWQGGQSNSSTSYEDFPEYCLGDSDELCPVYESESETEYDDRVQIALSSEFFGVGIGYAYSGGDITYSKQNVEFIEAADTTETGVYRVRTNKSSHNATSHILSAKYGTYGSGIYAAVVFGMNEYFYAGLKDTIQLEGLFAYAMNDWTFSINYESVEDDDANDTIFSQSALQAEYAVTPSFYTYAGYQFDLGNDIGEDENDSWLIGGRYYF